MVSKGWGINPEKKTDSENLQREWTADLTEVGATDYTIIADEKALGLIESSVYDEGEAQAITDKVDVLVAKINEIIAVVNSSRADDTLKDKINEIIAGLT